MKIQYIVLSETNHYGWTGSLTTLAKAKKLLKIESEVFYIFEYSQIKNKPLQLKLKYPFNIYYDCLSINKYEEELFDEDDDFVIITYNDTFDKDCLVLTYKQ